ncbi:protein AMN1 homolog isoform 2-T2 [Pholidichthys leucotaenia]
MDSCALMNGQQQKDGFSLQPFQAALHFPQDATRNQGSWTTNGSCQYRTMNTEVQKQQNAPFPLHMGAYYNMQTSNWQASTGLLQKVPSWQMPVGNPKDNHKVLVGSQHNGSVNMPCDNSDFHSSYGFQGPAQQDFFQSLSTQNPSKRVNLNAACAQQEKPNQWSLHRTIVSNHQSAGILENMLHTVKGATMDQISAPITTATSFPLKMSSAFGKRKSFWAQHVQGNQTAQNQIYGQISNQQSYCPLPNMATSQSFQNQSNATYSGAQPMYNCSTSQTTQQYPPQHSAAPNTVRDSSNSDSHKAPLIHSLKQSSDRSPHCTETQRIALGHKEGEYTSASGTRPRPPPPPYPVVQHIIRQLAHKSRMTVSNQNMQPGISSGSENYNLNATQSLPLHSQHTLRMSGNRNTINVSLSQQLASSVCPKATRHSRGSVEADGAFLPRNREHLKRLVVSDVPLLEESTESISCQRKKRKSFVVNSFEMHSPIQQNDNLIHSSPGHTASKAVAVVQPLLTENCKNTSNHMTTGEALSNPEKELGQTTLLKNGESVYLREESNISLVNPPQCDPQVSVQTSVQSEKSVSKNNPENQSEEKTPTLSVLELSSLPTTLWTVAALNDLIMNIENAQLTQDGSKGIGSTEKILSLYWDGSLDILKTGKQNFENFSYQVEIEKFCSSYITSDFVVLQQVKKEFQKELKNYLVLKDNDVYSEMPYRSTWLNVNEQLDDIDKTSGFPWTLKHHFHTIESGTKPDEVKSVSSIPASGVSEVKNFPLVQTHIEPVDVIEKQATFSEKSLNGTASPTNTDDAMASDPYCSLKILVLSPGKAKLLFEQVQDVLQSNADNKMEADRNNSSKSEIPSELDAALTESKPENEAVASVCTGKTRDEEMSYADKDNNLGKAVPVEELYLTEKEKNPAQGKNILSGFELGNELRQTIDLSEDNDQNKNINHPSTIVVSDAEENDLVIVINKMPDLSKSVDQCEQAKQKHEVLKQCKPNKHDQNEDEASLKTSASQCANKEKTERKWNNLHIHGEFGVKVSKKFKSPVELEPQHVGEGVLECKKGCDDGELQPSTSKCQTAQLVLFGSTKQEKCDTAGVRRSYTNSSASVGSKPPEVLTVNFNSSSWKPSEAILRKNFSVKQRIHLNWWKSFHHPKIWHRIKLRRLQHCSGSTLRMCPKQKLTAASEGGVVDEDFRHCQKTGTSLKNRLEQATKKCIVTDHGKLSGKDHRHDAVLVEDKNVLKFSVLPNTFNFNDGSSERKETTSPVSGAWCPNPEKKHSPSGVPQTNSIFHEYQKKYKEKTGSSADK